MYDRDGGVCSTGKAFDCDSIGRSFNCQAREDQQQPRAVSKARRKPSVGGVHGAGVQHRVVGKRSSAARSKALRRVHIDRLEREQSSLESHVTLQRQHLGLLASNHCDLVAQNRQLSERSISSREILKTRENALEAMHARCAHLRAVELSTAAASPDCQVHQLLPCSLLSIPGKVDKYGLKPKFIRQRCSPAASYTGVAVCSIGTDLLDSQRAPHSCETDTQWLLEAHAHIDSALLLPHLELLCANSTWGSAHQNDVAGPHLQAAKEAVDASVFFPESAGVPLPCGAALLPPPDALHSPSWDSLEVSTQEASGLQLSQPLPAFTDSGELLDFRNHPSCHSTETLMFPQTITSPEGARQEIQMGYASCGSQSPTSNFYKATRPGVAPAPDDAKGKNNAIKLMQPQSGAARQLPGASFPSQGRIQRIGDIRIAAPPVTLHIRVAGGATVSPATPLPTVSPFLLPPFPMPAPHFTKSHAPSAPFIGGGKAVSAFAALAAVPFPPSSTPPLDAPFQAVMLPAVPMMDHGALDQLLDSFGDERAVVPHALC